MRGNQAAGGSKIFLPTSPHTPQKQNTSITVDMSLMFCLLRYSLFSFRQAESAFAMMETLYKKLRSSRASSSSHRPLYKDESSNEDLSTASEELLESKDNESVDFDVGPRNNKRKSLIWAVAAHSFIFAIYTVGLFAASSFFKQRAGPPTLVYSKMRIQSSPL